MLTTLVSELPTERVADRGTSQTPPGGLKRRVVERAGAVTRELTDPLTVPALLRSGPCVAWLDLLTPTEDEMWRAAEALRIDASILSGGAAHVAACRVGGEPPRARLDVFQECYRLTVPVLVAAGTDAADAADGAASGDSRGVRDQKIPADARWSGADPWKAEPVVFVVGRAFLVTVRGAALPQLNRVTQAWRNDPGSPTDGPAPLLYALLDTIMDGFFPVVDAMVERVERLEAEVLYARRQSRRESTKQMDALFQVKEDLLELRQLVAPEREVLQLLQRGPLPLFEAHAQVYLRDLYDSVIRLTETIDGYQELVTTVMQSYASEVSIDLNEIAKALTALTVVIGVPIVITTIYGMNYDAVPEIDWALGYPYVLALMVTCALVLILVFRRRGWL